MSRVLAVATLLTTTLLAAACGGGDDRLSREELATEANAICTKYEEQIDAVEEPQDVDDIGRFVDETRPLVEDGVDELSELEPAEDIEGDYDRWISMNEENLEVFDELEQAATEGDEARVQEIIEETERTEQDADELAEDLGLDECAND